MGYQTVRSKETKLATQLQKTSPNPKQNVLIEVSELTKRFDNITAVDRISFTVRQGELFGFLGPNGAGKTTTINILTGLARPDSGDVRISGLDISKNPKIAQHLIGIVPDESNLYPELSGFDNLCFCASLYGVRKSEGQTRARELLETFDLKEAADRKFAGYSKGMKRKLTIAAGIIHRPEILFLDEPTSGVDTVARSQFWEILHLLKEKWDITILITTHYMSEAEHCDRAVLLKNGKKVEDDTITDLYKKYPNAKTFEEIFSSYYRDEA